MFQNLKSFHFRDEEFKDMDLKSSKRGFHRSPGTNNSVVKGNETRLVRCVNCGWVCDREREVRLPEESFARLGINYGSQLSANSSIADRLSLTYGIYGMPFNAKTKQTALTSINTGNDVYDSSTVNAPFTFECWALGNSNGGSTLGNICNKGHGITDAQIGYQIHVFAGNSNLMKVGMNVAHGNGADTSRATFADNSSNGAFQIGRLNHVVMVYNELGDKNITAYINGVSISGTLTAGTGNVIDDSSKPLYIGNKLNGSVTWDGYIGNIRVYHNKALSAAQVLNNYNGTITAGATCYWPFKEGAGVSTFDTIGSYELDFGVITNSVFAANSSNNAPPWKLFFGNSKSVDSYYERTVRGGCPCCGSFLYDKKPMESIII